MRKGFKGFMNKVFKVVWSKSKECYVVVPEIAKNNSGKKKVLASVLAGLALVGVGAQMGTPVDAYRSPDGSVNTQDSRINIAANAKPNNTVGVNSIVVGYQNTTDDQNGTTALGANNTAKGNSALAVGNENTATNGAATAIGAGNEATGDTSVAIGNKSNASGDHSIAIGAYNNQNWTHGSNVTTPKPAGGYSLAVGNFNDALGSRATAIGSYTIAKGEWATAVGASTVASGDGDVAIGDTSKTNATGVGHAVAVGWHAETGAANAVAVGPSALASGKNSVSVGTNNNSRVQDTVTMGQGNDAKTMGGIAIGKNNMVDSTNGGTNDPETRDENSQIAIGRDNTATHLDTIAIGRDTYATGSGATVVGARADASGNNAIAIGNSGKNSRRVIASGVNSIAVGMQSQATGEATIAQGAAAEAAGNFGIAVGRISKAKANYSQAYGNEATSSTMGSIAMGALAKGGNDNGAASEGGSVAVGNAAWATGNRAIAIGSIRPTEGNLKYPTGVGRDVATGLQGTDYNTQATANQAIAVGSGARTEAQNSITMGTNAKVDATANGYTYQKTNNSGVKETLTLSTDPTPTSGINGRTTYDAGNGIAIGRDSHVTGKTTSAIAIGNSALADDGAVAATVIGAGASSKSVSSVAIGTTANVQGGEGAIAVGSGATVTGNYDNASAFGSGATVNTTNGTALGAGAQTNVRGGVAIGALSQADERSGAGESTGFHAADRAREYQGENKGLADNNLQLFHADIAGGDAGMVSVGSDGIKRQITNVASGTSDYDAVNVAQLRNVGVVVTGDTGKSDFLVHDGKLNVLGTGRVSTTAANDGAKDSKITVAFDDTGMVKAGKNVTVDEKTVNGRTTYTINAADAAAKYDFLTNAKANGGKLDGTATPTKVESGQTVTYAAGKNLTVKQDIDQSAGEQTYTYSLNKDIDLTPDGSLKIGDTNITNNGLTINNGPSITKTGINAGGLNITNVKAGVNDNDAVNVSQLKKVRADERHIKPGEYAVDANGKVTMTYLDGNNNDVANETAVITGIAKQDLSNINKGGETVIQNLAKKSIDMENGKNTTASHRDVNGVKTFKVDVEGDLTDITSITNKDGDGKVVFGGNQTVNVAGDHNINLNAKVGDITGLTNVTLDAPDFAKKGRAATEEQLKIVNNGFNNTVGLTGNTGATDLQKLNQAGGLSFGVIGANNGQYIKTTASGSNVAVDLSDDAKGKLNNTVEVRGKNAAKVTSVTENTVDGGKKTIYTVDVDNVTPTAASTEKVKAKADSSSSTDTNIAKVTPQTGDQYGDAGATYEVNVSRNDVKDAAREAVTVNTTNTTNNPITVTPVQDETNHNTTYTVTFDGNKAATQIPLTYKANGQNAQTVTLNKGLNFTNGSNTTASVAADGVVKYDLNNNIDLTPNGSLKIGDTILNNGGLTITGGPSVTKTGINAGNLNITNVKAGVNDTDAVNVKQLKDARTVVTSNDNSVTVNKTENGNQVTYDLHVAPGAAQSVWNVKSTGNTTADSETAAKTISDGKTVEMAAGKNLTVKQTSNNDGAKVEFDLANDIKIGKDGRDGVDGKIGVNGKDGSSVVINGKDGSIGLNGKDGKDGLTMKGEKGQPGLNGKDGITRIVYEDNNHDKHEVATLDDGLNFTGNNTDTVNKQKLNSLVKVQGEGVDKNTSATFKSAAGNINVKADGTDTLEVQLNKDLKNITTIKNDGPATLTIGGNEFKFDGGNVNMGDNNITNLKSGIVNNNSTDDTNGANIGDVKTISKANDLHIAPTTSNRQGETTTSYAYDTASKSVTLKYNDGNGANQAGTIAKIDLSGLADQIKDGYSFSTDAKGNVVGNHAVTAVGNGKTVSYAAGDNLTIAQNIDNATGEQTYTYALSNDIKIGKDGKDGIDGKIGVNGKDGSSVVINGKDGSIGLNGKDGKDGLTMKAKDGQPGVNGKDGITRIVYEDNSKTTHEVATLDDGMKYAGDDAQGTDKSKVIAKKLNQTMDIVGGANSTKLTDNNIGVNNVDGKLKVQLAQNIDLTPAGSLTIGDTMINDGGLSIHNGPSITKGGINAGNKTIVNVAPGVNGTDAVNVNQLNSARTEVEEGDNVKVTSRKGANGQTIYKVSATGVNLGDAELKYSANGTNTQSVKLSQGLNFVDGNYTSASVDANGQVKYDVTIGKVKDGVDGKPGVDGNDGIATVKTVVDTINNSGWKANATGNVVGTSTATIVKPGSTVNYGAGKNLNVKQTVNGDEQTYEFALDKDLKELNSVQTNTIHLGSPTSHTTINYNAGNDRIEYTTKNGTKQVANLDDIWTIQANGTDVKPVGGKVNVVGGDHIKVSTDAAGKMTISADGVGTMNGFNVKSTGNTTNDSDKTAKNITDGKTVEFSGGKNLTVKQTNTADGAKVEFALNNNIDLTPNGSVTIGDTVVNNDGLTITGGPTITKNNVDMGGQQIHNVKSGGDVDSNGANIGDIKRISKANDTRIKDGNYEVSQNGTVEMTYVDGSGKQLVDEHGNPVKATISGIARQDLSNITNEGKKVITGLGTIVKAGQNVSVDEATDNATGQKTYTVNADLSGAKVNASVGTEGSGVAKGLKNPVKVEKGTQYIAGDNMVVERKPVEGDDKLDNSITYSLAHDLTEINSISNGGATLRINSNPGGNKYDRDTAVTPAFEVHGGNLSMTGNRIVNLAPGIDGTDGVNVNQLRDSLTTVKSTDGTVRVTDLSTDPNKHEYDLHVNPAADPRVDKLGEEIGHVGAQSAALSALKPIQYDPMEPTQIMAGYGNYRGNSALALGVAHYKNESTMFHAGVSWAGGNGHMMANAGVTWKVGNRDSEAAVADRYRKGPISSTYAMQTEVASMKAQNAGLKGEVSDLKAENEQIKAQNAGLQSEVDQLKAQMAAMMAKLGM